MKAIVSSNSRIRYPEHFIVGEDSIVDDYCYFSTKVIIGIATHIASGCSVAGGYSRQFKIGDFCSLSSGVKIWCTSDDFVNDLVTIIPQGVEQVKTHLISGDVTFGDYTAAGSNSVVMPNNVIPEGTVIGALSFVPPEFDFRPWSVYAGTPVRLIGPRNRPNVEQQVRKLQSMLAAREQTIMNRKIPWWVPEIGPKEYDLVKDVLDSNYINDGDVTEQFERRLAELLGVKYVVAVTSGTTAITLALAGLGVGAGDDVLIPDVTFIATANAVKLAGANPVLVDVDPRTLNIDPDAAERAVTARTRAIVPVHVSGRAADMDAIGHLAQRHELFVVEDAAEGFVSRRGNRCLGTLGHAGCLSFSPNKTITTGQGGAILTDDERLYVRLRELKDQGRPVRGTGGDDIHHSVGYNFKFTNLQAAVGLAQLTYLETRLARMRRTYSIYATQLEKVEGIRLPGFSLDVGESPQWTDAIVERRDDLDRFLLDRNVHCRRFWFPIHTQLPYRLPDQLFPNSSSVCPHAIWLPSAFTLSDSDVNDVCGHVKEFLTSWVGEVANARRTN